MRCLSLPLCKSLFRAAAAFLALFIAAVFAAQPERLREAKVAEVENAPRVYMIGDSTMANKPIEPPNPERGWGQLLPKFFKNPDMVSNHAVNGRSSKSFLDEGRWQVVLDALQPNDWVVIQFGHNDEKRKDPTRYTDPGGSFRDNLRRFVDEAREKQANPLLATCVVRRKWDETGKQLVDTHGDYPDATRAVADEEKVPLLEMHDLTRQLELAHGQEGSKRLHLWIAPAVYESMPEGARDDTHYSAYGAERVAALAVQEMLRLQLPLTEWLISAQSNYQH